MLVLRTLFLISCLHDRTAVSSGAKIGLLNPFYSALPVYFHVPRKLYGGTFFIDHHDLNPKQGY